MSTKALTALLWLQLIFGCVAMILAWGPMFSGAMGVEWTTGLQKELGDLQQSADYREPPKLSGLSYSKIIARQKDQWYDYLHLGGWCFFSAGGLVVASALELWLVHRLKRQFTSQAMAQKPDVGIVRPL